MTVQFLKGVVGKIELKCELIFEKFSFLRTYVLTVLRIAVYVHCTKPEHDTSIF